MKGAELKQNCKKLISQLQQTEEELEAEYRKRRRDFHAILRLEERRRNIENQLHKLLKPLVLKRDGSKCRACGSAEGLELVRLYGGLAEPVKVSEKRIFMRRPPAEKRWAEENLFILCRECHKRFDSFVGRMWRRDLGDITVEEAVELLRSGKMATLKEATEALRSGKTIEEPPSLRRFRESYLEALKCQRFRTLFKTLRKTVVLFKQGCPALAKSHMRFVKREWGYASQMLPPEIKGECSQLMEEFYRSSCVDEAERAEAKIREAIMSYLEKSVSPRMFERFRKVLSEQDKALAEGFRGGIAVQRF